MLRFSTAVISQAVWSVSNCPDTSIQNSLKRCDLSCSYKCLKLINPFISSSLDSEINSPSVSKAAEKMINQNSDYGHPQSHTDSPLFPLSGRRPPTVVAALMEKACDSFASFTTKTSYYTQFMRNNCCRWNTRSIYFTPYRLPKVRTEMMNKWFHDNIRKCITMGSELIFRKSKISPLLGKLTLYHHMTTCDWITSGILL